MASLEYLNNQLTECNLLIEKINSVRSELTNAYNQLEDATYIGNYYSIDNISADGNSISIQRNRLLDISNNLNNNISSISNTITSVKNRIIEEENRIKREENERLERERLERERLERERLEQERLEQEQVLKKQEPIQSTPKNVSKPVITQKKSSNNGKTVPDYGAWERERHRG